MHPKDSRGGRRVVVVTLRVLGALAFCAMLLFEGQAASWATAAPTASASGRPQQLSPWSFVQSAATGSAYRSGSAFTPMSAGAPAERSTASSADPAPTPPRTMDEDQYAALLLVGGVLVMTQIAMLLTLWGKR